MRAPNFFKSLDELKRHKDYLHAEEVSEKAMELFLARKGRATIEKCLADAEKAIVGIDKFLYERLHEVNKKEAEDF